MPVNIDTVYQTVQALANKEQRGYLTPQEFNLFANQAQADIFEQYFYDLNAFRGAKPQQRQVGDSVTFLQHKLANVDGVTYTNTEPVVNGTDLQTAGHTGQIFVTVGGVRKSMRVINEDEIHDLRGSEWHRAAFDEAVYFEDGYQRIQVWTGASQITSGVTCEYVVGRPALVYWGYVVVNEKPTYDPSSTVHFPLHLSEQADLVVKILKLAGISMEDPQLIQAASSEEQQNVQQENK